MLETFRPNEPVVTGGLYAAYADTGRLLRQFHLPTGCCFPLIAGAAYFAPVGVLQADCY